MSDWSEITAQSPGRDPVLVCRQGEQWVAVGYRAADHGWSGWLAAGDRPLPGTPTHWQPLPLPMEAA